MRRAPNPPYDKWLKVEGSPVKKIRFRKSGNVDVIIVPRRRNESYRKVKKQVRKLQQSGALEPGPMFQKFRKAAKISKTGKKRNPLTAKQEQLYRKAEAIDDRFQKALEKKYGSRAGDYRYRYDLPAHLKRLGKAMQLAMDRYRESLRTENPAKEYKVQVHYISGWKTRMSTPDKAKADREAKEIRMTEDVSKVRVIQA
jgi:hypothetical protein